MTKTVGEMIDALVGREGGFSDHPSDKGGATRWGVTEQVARAYGYSGPMRELPRETAVTIYHRRYWQKPGFDLVWEVFPNLAVEMFDTGVNMGQTVPVKFLQRSLNALNRRGGDWPDMAVDGMLGALTFAALRQFSRERGAAAEPVLLRCLDGLQLARYLDITEAREANEDFFFGWVSNRVGALA
jgi:lysozyme family protein